MRTAQICVIFWTVLYNSFAVAGNMESGYGWGENAGWISFSAAETSAYVDSKNFTGFVWSENYGWICLSCKTTASCEIEYGVVNDGEGNLSGFAWAENVGWINFSPVVSGDPGDYGVKIDSNGRFSGYAWGENIGWINFNDAQLFGAGVKACKVTIEDLTAFSQQWLQSCSVVNDFCSGADFVESGTVDFSDFAFFALYWLDFCPDTWLAD